MIRVDAWPLKERRTLIGAFTDVDDTLTKDGEVQSAALRSLGYLGQAGFPVIPVTGRSVGWCEERMVRWPVPAVVAENGAVALLKPSYKPEGGNAALVYGDPIPPIKIYYADAATRSANYERMQQVAALIMEQVPGAALARDSAGRETDIAIDHSEFAQLSGPAIAQVHALMLEHGMNASVSSIHVNGWYGDHTKWSGAQWVVRALYNRELQDEITNWAFVGDSANDEIMFQHFYQSIGVANVAPHIPRMRYRPRFVTQGERGAGFAELTRLFIEGFMYSE